MRYINAAEMAKRLDVNIRTVQLWAKNGKLPNAKKLNRDWLIPISEDTDAESLPITSKDDEKSTLSGIMPLLNASFDVGCCEEYIDSIDDAEISDIAWAEYYYFSAQPSKAVQMSEKYIESPDFEKKISASLIYIFANLSLGRIAAVNERINIVREYIKQRSTDETDPKIQALCAFMSDTINILFHLPTDSDISHSVQSAQSSQPAQSTQFSQSTKSTQSLFSRSDTVSANTHLRFLPDGLKLFGCYVIAHKAYFEQNYAQSLGIIETSLAWQEKIYPIAMIYLHLVAVMDLMCLGEKERAREHFMQAWELARPDNLIQPISEHHGLTYGMIETCLKRDFPEDYRKIIEVTYRFSESWRSIHNACVSRPITGNLTTTEFSIAMLAKRGWSNQQIADYMNLSVHTVKQYMSIIFQKLGITSRKQISDHMLR